MTIKYKTRARGPYKKRKLPVGSTDRAAPAREAKRLRRMQFLQEATRTKEPVHFYGTPVDLADFISRLSRNFSGGSV